MNTYTLTQAQLNDCVFCDGFAHNLLVSLKPNEQEPQAKEPPQADPLLGLRLERRVRPVGGET